MPERNVTLHGTRIPLWIMLCWVALWITASLMLLPTLSSAATLPFLESAFPFELQSANQKNLMKTLSEDLQSQRDDSIDFGLISQARKALRWDKDVLQALLRSRGYFAAQINSSLTENSLLHIIETGPQYIVKKLTLDFPDTVTPPSILPIAEGAPLQARFVLDTKKAIENHIEDNYCLYQIEVSYDARVNHQAAEAFLTFALKPSPSVSFLQPVLQGQQQIKETFLRHYIAFEPGDCFKRKQVETTRLNLLQSNLVARVETDLEIIDNDKVLTTYTMQEREHRTLALGIGWESDTGLAFTPGWEHRNLFHEGEKLEIDTILSEDKQNLISNLSFPHQWRKDQTLVLSVELQEETSQAFRETSGLLGAKLTRPMWRRWLGSLGTNLEFSRTIKDEVEDEVALLSFPLTLDYVRTNDQLNPTRGWALGSSVEPFVDLYQTGTRFNKTTLAASWYITGRDWWGTPTLAVRSAIGSITAGIDLERVPPDHRFYVGGGSSVRGYAYQLLGDLDEDGDPIGGLSFGEAVIEFRFRFSQNWGAAIFADGGYAYPGERPDFGKDFLWGAGVGLRYFTSFAPIRFDIAAPLNKRTIADGDTTNDDSLQIYISLGQAF